jgi:membrane protease YdiL (CAAX protease family)
LDFRSAFYTPAGALRAPWRVLFFIGALLVCGVVAAGLIGPLAVNVFRIAGIRSQTVSSVIDVVSAFGATWLALRWLEKKPWSDVGLDRDAARPTLFGLGFATGAVAVALPILLLIVIGWLDRVPSTTTAWGQPLVRITLLLLPAALAEEVITRGYLLTVIRDALNWRWAVALTSVAFGLLHVMNPGANVQSVTLVALAGVFLATIRIATNSLYAAWMAHFAWNWVMAAIFHAPVSGYAFDLPAYRYVDAGPDWATGGTWGPESGIPAGLAMIAGTGLLLLRQRRRAEGDR